MSMEETQTDLFAPLVVTEEGRPDVRLPSGHPGHGDQVYKAHRDQIAEAALRHRSGEPLPRIHYRPEDHRTWNYICSSLDDLMTEYASDPILEARRDLGLPIDHVPQLADTSKRLNELSGFQLAPAAGIVPMQDFYGTLADRVFNATQYIRHESDPLFSPEPDMLHEVVGHGTTLASPRLAEVYVQAGSAARRMETTEGLQAVSRIFWFTLECGVLWEHGRPTAYGATLLSSLGEMENFRHADIRPLDAQGMLRQDYDVTTYQQVLYGAESLDHLEEFAGEFFSTVHEDSLAEAGVTAS